MPGYDPGDVVFVPNTLRSDGKQVVGDIVVQMPKAGTAVGATVTNNRSFGADASGLYNKLHKRMHNDFFSVTVVAS
jgi:hypothetical protein